MKTTTKKLHYLIAGAAAWMSPLMLAAAQAEAATVKTQTLLEKLNMPAIWILVVCSMMILYVVTDGYLNSRMNVLVPPLDLEKLRDFFRGGNYQEAFDYCKENPNTLNTVVYAALKNAPSCKEATEEAVLSAIHRENTIFNNKIAYLSVIGVIAPMIGLTGTVLGMIDAFDAMGSTGAVDPAKLSGAIGHVLYATAGGLIVAIPAFVFYYLLRNRIGAVMHAIQEEVADLFRKFPFEQMAPYEMVGGESYAALPSFLQGGYAEEGYYEEGTEETPAQ